MRIVLFVVLGLVLLIGGGVAFFPMSMAADWAAQRAPDLKFTQASGSVWDGKLTDVSYGEQKIGDLSVKTELFSLLGGKATGTVGLTREGVAGQASLAYGISDGSLDVKDMLISGETASVPGMPQAIARTDGKFTLALKDVKFVNNLCDTASGEVWTDALTQVNYKGWVGPELRGPVSCQGGKLNVRASGKAATGEDVVASMNISQHLDMEMTATVENASQGAMEALTAIGFVADGSNRLVLKHALGAQ